MEMGTGKSRTAIEIARQWGVGNVVWFAPVSLKETVRQEIVKHVKWGRPYVFNGTTARRGLPRHFWTIIGIESMSSSNRQILAAFESVNNNTLVVVDESSFIKGHKSYRTLRITEIGRRAGYRLILTGTPLSQGVEDLFAQMRFLDTSILGYSSWYSFARNHLEFSEKYPGLILRAHNTGLLAEKIAPITYQVTKDECIDLPPKIYKTVYCEMTDRQREIYAATKMEILSDADDMDSYVIFKLFTALQQVASGYCRIGKEWREIENSRLSTLLSVAEKVSTQTIIWCKFVRSALKIYDALKNCSLLCGHLSERQRNEEIEKFKAGNTRFLVSTLGCGGHGLNLTEAKTAIFYESSFKYAQRAQAEDRCHRIGQTQSVLYVDVVCSPSIDDRIMSALEHKRNVVEEFKAEVERVKDNTERLKTILEAL